MYGAGVAAAAGAAARRRRGILLLNKDSKVGFNFLSRVLVFPACESAGGHLHTCIPSGCLPNLPKRIPSCRLPKSSKKDPLIPPTYESPPAAYIAASESPHAAFWKSV